LSQLRRRPAEIPRVEPAAILRDRGRDSQRDLLYLLRVAGDPVLGGEHAGEYAVIIPVHQRAPFRGPQACLLPLQRPLLGNAA
jgi:hypothetical protein